MNLHHYLLKRTSEINLLKTQDYDMMFYFNTAPSILYTLKYIDLLSIVLLCVPVPGPPILFSLFCNMHGWDHLINMLVRAVSITK